MSLIAALVLGYCAKRAYNIITDSRSKPYKRTISTNTMSTATIAKAWAPTANLSTREKEWEVIRRAIKKNQQHALDNMGPEGSLDPAAEIWRKKVAESFKEGWEKDPVILALQKEARVNRNRSQEVIWEWYN